MSTKCLLTKNPCGNKRTLHNDHTVFLAYQFSSDYYRGFDLLSSVRLGVESANQEAKKSGLSVSFKQVSRNEGFHIWCEICEGIINSSVCIFEISDNNPNVYLELGLAIAHGKEIVLVRNRTSGDVPSDLAGIKYVSYSNESELEELHIIFAQIIAKTIFELQSSVGGINDDRIS